MSFDSFSLVADIQIVKQGSCNFIVKINNHLGAAFAVYFYAVIFKIHILNIDTDTLGYTNTRAEQEREQCQVTQLCLLMVCKLVRGQLFPGLHLI